MVDIINGINCSRLYPSRSTGYIRTFYQQLLFRTIRHSIPIHAVSRNIAIPYKYLHCVLSCTVYCNCPCLFVCLCVFVCGSALLQPAHSVCVASGRFLHYFVYFSVPKIYTSYITGIKLTWPMAPLHHIYHRLSYMFQSYLLLSVCNAKLTYYMLSNALYKVDFSTPVSS